MSSSTFIEPKGANGVEDGKSNSDSNLANLVVVYGKNGINIDQKDLETLIEEKAVKTISVIRISSPTPSMEEAEETAKVEAAKDALENTEHSDTEVIDGENTVGGKNDNSNPNSEDDESSSSGTEQNDENQNGNSENDDKIEKSSRRNRNLRRKSLRKQQKSFSKKRDKKDREIMGLTLEGFYEADAALQIAKEACKMAGIPYIRNTAEYEFMLFVIRNDHCYTPYTSPEQMKAKLMADKLEGEKLPFNTRKIQPQFNMPSKQLMAKMKKLPFEILSPASNKLAVKKLLDDRLAKDKTDEANFKPQKSQNPTTAENMDDISDEDEESYELIDIEDSDFTGSEVSADSDNDRDSDLDFNVNNRKTKKRRLTLAQKKARRSINAKIQERRLPSSTSSQDEGTKPQPTSSTIAVSNVMVAASSSATIINSQYAPTIKTRVIPRNYIITSRQIRPPLPPQIPTTLSKVRPILAAGSTEATMDAKAIYQKSPSINPVPLRAEQIVRICDNKASAAPHQNVAKTQPVTQPAVKEIVINKALSSPKGCFTELTTLISEAEKATNQTSTSTSVQQLQPSTPTSTNMTRNVIGTVNTGTPSSRTCFTRIDGTATKNTLPAQISVETHQSSSELAAEHDKQLDLIDSIVNDELNKSMDNLAEQSSISTDENIPKIVQMLENTEKTLVTSSSSSSSTSSSAAAAAATIVSAPTIDTSSNVNTNNNNNNTATTTSVDDIDISHDLPEDLLQHVVELIKDDKTLQEAVEKEIMEQENSFGNEQQHSNQSTTTTPLPIVPTTPSRSIIQMSISNTMTTSSVVALPNDGTSSFGDSSPMSRRDPIQIVRGNGRVITLPPIEAPTTRAKRRAQVLPSGAGVGSSVESSPQTHMFNESSMEGSLHSNTSFVGMTPTTLAALPPATTENVEKKPTTKRRNSKEASTRSARKSTSNKSKRNSVSAVKQDDAEDATESQADDDDPKKLWCICRQPHNNRFMICCDACGDWFHGTCVNVTKSMGREMEQKGLEWSCPQCIKKRDEKTQRKLTDMLEVRRTSTQSSIEEKIKGTIEPKKTITSEKQVTAIKREALEVKKPSTSIQQTIIQTPTSKKASNVQNQKRITASTPSKIASTNMSNIVTAGTPVQLSSSSSSSSSSKIGKTLLLTPVRVVTSTPATPVVKPPSTPSTPTVAAAPKIPCAFCKKAARSNSVYCSDDCIRRCAQNAINVYTAKSEEQEMVSNISSSSSSSTNIIDDKKKKAKGLFEDVLSMADRKPKVERMVVYERKSGTKLSGSNAPTTFTIRKWLHDNPTYEIVLPGSQLSIDIEKQQTQRSADGNKQIAPPPPRTPNLKVAISAASTPHKSTLQSPNNQKQISSTTKESSSAASANSQMIIKSIKQNDSANTTPSPRPNTPKPSRSAQQQQQPQQHAHNRSDNKSPRNEPKEEIKTKERQLKRQSSDVSSTGSSNSNKKQDTSTSAASSQDNEPIRRNVRRTLKEQIMQRMNETSSQSSDAATNQLKLTPEDVDAFVKETEAELFNMFNRDTGARYKAKYRSLIFNIKDRKNRTLFAKICAKQIEPKQLVHMSPEELASQELAQWRQNENKHQLEMIKKSELDLLSCTKNFLFKNHKGEEVIESKESGAVCVNLDMTIPVEDVVNVLNNSNDIVDDSEISSAVIAESKAKQLLSSSTGGSTDEPQTKYNIPDQEIEKADGSKSLVKQSYDSEKERSRDKRHRSKSRESEKDRDRDRGRERRHRSRSKDVEKEKERERRHRSRERHYQRDKSRSRRKSHSRSKSRSRSEEKRSKSSHKERDRERDRERERERDKTKEKKASSSSSNASKSTAISQIHSKEKQRNSPIAIAIGAAKLKPIVQQQKSLECFSLIDQIIESSKTVEEAANLVHEKSKDKEKHKEQQAQQQQQSPVIASSSTTVESAASSTTTVTATTTTSTTKTTAQPDQPASSTADSDQEPSSTVSIPTPPHDPYAGDREEDEEDDEEPSFSRSGSPNLESIQQQLWIGGLCMNEVATLQMKLYHLIGNTRNLGRLLAENLDVVGRIDGETVWEYLWKIRKSPNKEIVLIRLMPYNENDADAYANLFQYLDKKKRLGVIKSITPQIKDFYIYPLGSGKQLPKVLQVTSHNDFYNDPYRADMIIGILVRVLGKRTTAPAPSAVAISAAAAAKLARRNHIEADSFTPPGSPKRSRKRSHKGDIDMDAIIKAPIGAKSMKKSSKIGTDADEPYSPGGSSEDDALPQYSGKRPSSLHLGLSNADEDLKRKMEEINRQIAAQEMEIAGLLNVEPNSSGTALSNISIPANLPQILASIKSKDMKSLGDHVPQMNTNFDEYNPEEAALSSYKSSARHTPSTTKTSTSRLAQLSEAELLSMVPDDMLDPQPPSKKKAKLSNESSYYQEPPPPGV